MLCPLCNHDGAHPSWFGSHTYRGQEFPYLECDSCGTLFCDPMPDAETLGHMYGLEFLEQFRDGEIPDVSDSPVTKWLQQAKQKGSFIDYGCGEGLYLMAADKAGWHARGFEFDGDVARSIEKKTGISVVSDAAQLESGADALLLSDVIEHFTDLNRQTPEILKLLKPGGILIAQGPMESNPTLFTWVLRLARTLRGAPSVEAAPYHVIMATAKGQRRFFRRFGLKELRFSVYEVAWPLPEKLTAEQWKQPRMASLFLVRRLSKLLCALRPGRSGNRYFYVGRVPTKTK